MLSSFRRTNFSKIEAAEPYFWIIDLQPGFLEVMLAEFGEHKFLKFYPCSKIIFCNPSFKNLCSPN
jgi:hypothetical protein